MATSYSLECIVAPTANSGEIFLTEAMAHCRLSESLDAAQYAVLTDLLLAAREVVEERTGLALVPQDWRLRLPGFADVIALPKPPVQSVGITYVDPDGETQTLPIAGYTAHAGCMPGIVTPAAGYQWPDVHSEVRFPVTLDFICGYTSADHMPRRAKQAILLLVSHWYENRTAVAPGSMSDVPQAFESLVKQLDIGTGWVL